VTFSGSSNQDGHKALTYSWNFGDGEVGAGKVVVHAYNAVGSYTATLTVSESGGLSGTDSVTINVGFGGMPDLMHLWQGQRVDYIFMPIGGGSASVTLSAGSLPPGLDLTAGRLTGNPTACGTWNLTLTVNDGVNPPEPHDLTIVVSRAGFARFRRDTWR
jgi:chitodextrinase